MKRLLIGMGFAVLAAGAPVQAGDEIKVIVTNSGATTTTFHNAGSAINITMSANTTLINITAVDEVSDVEGVLRRWRIPPSGGDMTALSGDLGGLVVTHETRRAATSLAGHMKEDIEGSVIVGKLYRGGQHRAGPLHLPRLS